MLPLAGSWTLDSFSRHLGGLDLFRGARARACPRSATTAAGRSSRPRPTSRCARRAARSPTRSGASRSRSRSSSRCASASRRAPSRSRAGSPPTRACASSSTRRRPGTTRCSTRSPRRARWRRSTSRAPTRARRSTSRPTPRSTAAAPRRSPTRGWRTPTSRVPEADAALRPHRDRITWDAPIHGVADIEALPFLPRTINVKPSRIGSWRELLRTYEWCAERGILTYGGGQSELGVGRGQIQYLAALFHGDEPNDIAPVGLRLGGVPGDRPAAEPARPGPRADRVSPALVDSTSPWRSSDRSGWSRRARSPRCSSSSPAPTRSSRRRRATSPPPRPSSARAPRSGWTPSARASTSASRSPPPARRSGCSCGAWPRPRSRSPSAAPATSRSAAEKLGQTPPTNRQLLALRVMGVIAPPAERRASCAASAASCC